MNDSEQTRKAVSGFLQKQGFPINLPLPLPERTGVRGAREVAERVVLLYALAGLAHDADAEALRDWLTENGLHSKLLPPEQTLLSGRELSEQEMIDLSWKQESLYALAWSGTLVDQLPLPYTECHLDEIFKKIPPEVEVGDFLDSFTLVPEEQIFFQADLHYCLHWVSRHPEVWGRAAAPGRLNVDVIIERRRALEWLINSSTPWDEIVLDT